MGLSSEWPFELKIIIFKAFEELLLVFYLISFFELYMKLLEDTKKKIFCKSFWRAFGINIFDLKNIYFRSFLSSFR